MKITRSEALEILEVQEGASGEECRKAYLKMSREWHPDKRLPEEREIATATFQKIGAAYKKLQEPERPRGSHYYYDDDSYYDEDDNDAYYYSDEEDDEYYDDEDEDIDFFFEMFQRAQGASFHVNGNGFYFVATPLGGAFSSGNIPGFRATRRAPQSSFFENDAEYQQRMWARERARAEAEADNARRAREVQEAKRQAALADRWLTKLPKPSLLRATETSISLTVDRTNARMAHFTSDALPSGFAWELQYRQVSGLNIMPPWSAISIDDCMSAMVSELRPGTQYSFRARTMHEAESGVKRWSEWTAEAKYKTSGVAPARAPTQSQASGEKKAAPASDESAEADDKKQGSGSSSSGDTGKPHGISNSNNNKRNKNQKKKNRYAQFYDAAAEGGGGGPSADVELDEKERARREAEAAAEVLREEERERAIRAAMEAAAADYAAATSQFAAQQPKEADSAFKSLEMASSSASADAGSSTTNAGKSKKNKTKTKKKSKDGAGAGKTTQHSQFADVVPKGAATSFAAASQPAMLPPRTREEARQNFGIEELDIMDDVANQASLQGMTVPEYLDYLDIQRYEMAILESMLEMQAQSGRYVDSPIEEEIVFEPETRSASYYSAELDPPQRQETSGFSIEEEVWYDLTTDPANSTGFEAARSEDAAAAAVVAPDRYEEVASVQQSHQDHSPSNQTSNNGASEDTRKVGGRRRTPRRTPRVQSAEPEQGHGPTRPSQTAGTSGTSDHPRQAPAVSDAPGQQAGQKQRRRRYKKNKDATPTAPAAVGGDELADKVSAKTAPAPAQTATRSGDAAMEMDELLRMLLPTVA